MSDSIPTRSIGTDRSSRFIGRAHTFIGRHRQALYLVGILLLATLLRLPLLTHSPPGFYVDEASTGYDAYSILLTGRDQYGEFLPLFARTFGAFNEALYRYLTVLPVWLFGLTEFSVRFPAAIAGILTVAAVYFLAKELFNEKVALLAALLMAISPWHIQFSRIGFRGILLPLFLCLGLLFFLKGIKKPVYLLLSALMFSIALYTYSPARVFVPLFLITLAILYRRALRRAGILAVISGGLFLFAFIILSRYWLSARGIAASVYSLDTDVAELLRAYASYYGLSFLFLRGDPIARHSIIYFGQLHLFELLTVTVGVIFLIGERQRPFWILLAWLILYPSPAWLTEASHALRAIAGIPLFVLLSAYGLYKLGTLLKDRARVIFLSLTAAIITISVAWHAYVYFTVYPVYSALAWQYGMKEMIAYSESEAYENVYISDRYFIPHMFVLFYTAYPPQAYHQEALLSIGEGQFRYSDLSVGKYHITSARQMSQLRHKNALLMLFPEEEAYLAHRPDCAQVHAAIRPNGTLAGTLFECRSPGP